MLQRRGCLIDIERPALPEQVFADACLCLPNGPPETVLRADALGNGVAQSRLESFVNRPAHPNPS